MLLLSLLPHLASATPLPIVDGEPTASFEAVGALLVCEDSNCHDICSGTLISSTWVITAGHCTELIKQNFDNYKLSFAFGYDLSDPFDIIEIDFYLTHPSYNSETLEADIGLLHLDNPSYIAPMGLTTLTPDLSWNELTYVGFGVTEENTGDSGIKRMVDIPIAEITKDFIVANDPLEQANLCYGDSGGAAIKKINNDWVLVGVNSWVNDNDDTPCTGGWSGATRLDIHMDWIASNTPVSVNKTTPSGSDANIPDNEIFNNEDTHVGFGQQTGCNQFPRLTIPLYVIPLIFLRRKRVINADS